MKDFEKNMEEIFDIEMDTGELAKAETEQVPVKSEDDQKKDYEYSRGQLYSLIEKGREALDGALEVAQESGHPRAYEVAVNAMKQVADTTDKLLDLQKKMNDLNAPTKKAGPTTVNNTMFVGSTADLAKMLKNASKNIQDK